MILVTGGTGVMGSMLVRKLFETGCQVRIFTLPDDPFVDRVAKYVCDFRYGDIANNEDVRGICEGIQTVYHLAAVIIARDERRYRIINVHGTKNLVEDAKAAKVKHFIHVSSASVTYPVLTPYAASKQRAEELVRHSGLPFTIIRPTLVYDKKRGGQEFDIFLDYLQKYPFVPVIGRGNAIKRPVFVKDIIAGLVALHNTEAHGKIYNFSGAEALTMRDFTHLCLRLLDLPKKPIISLPVWLCRLMTIVLEKTMQEPPVKWSNVAGVLQDANLDPAEAIKDIGYAPAKVTDKLPACFPRHSG